MSNERVEDQQFEQRLLRSAEADNPKHDTRAAWERFSAVTTYVASRVETVSAVHKVDKTAASNTPAVGTVASPRTTVAGAELTQAGAGITFSGVGLGMVVGALLTSGVWLMLRSDSQPTAVAAGAPSAVSFAATSPAGLALDSGHAAAPGPSASNAPVARAAASAALGAPRTSQSRSGASRVNDGKAAASNSSLSEQVRLLDHAREALRAGRPGYALGWVERARIEFPHSVLTPDWDFVEIEALRAQGSAVATERARSFLRKYPADPHAHEVRRELELAVSATP
jgi:hypothetical protein